MNTQQILLITVFMGSILLSGCQFVPLSDQGKQVNVLDINQAQDQQCKKLGEINSSVLDKLAFINRNQKAVSNELINLARNEAAKLGADSVVPAGSIKNGSQRFIAYQCVAVIYCEDESNKIHQNSDQCPHLTLLN